jgi:hypothetical protein
MEKRIDVIIGTDFIKSEYREPDWKKMNLDKGIKVGAVSSLFLELFFTLFPLFVGVVVFWLLGGF